MSATKETKRSIVVALPEDLIEALEAQADERVVGRGRLIELVLAQWVKDQAPKPIITFNPGGHPGGLVTR